MEEQMMTNSQDATAEVVDIQFRPGQKVYYFDPAGIVCKPGDAVIMDTARGPEFGICTGGNHTISVREVVSPLRPVLRLATEQDKKIAQENQEKEKRAFDICLQKIREQELDMQLVGAECAFDGSKLLFFFTADERVDFRELVKSLASVFHTRIELRQIGVRDKAKMVGGLGICGRPFCCASFLDDFQPVSIKMAKTQNLSLNPTKISGTCGRLMCCLKYEQDAYEDLIRTSPKLESFVDTPDGRGTVVEIDLLRQRVKVRMENQPETIGTYANTDIAVLRSGKARKSDPPIPAEIAPISNAPKQEEPEVVLESDTVLDPIRFRNSPEPVVAEETEVPEEAQETQEEHRPARNRRKNRRPRGGEEKQEAKPKEEREARQEKQKPEKTEKIEKIEKIEKAEVPEQAGEHKPAEKPHRRRPNYRHRRPRQNPTGEQNNG